MNSAPTAWKNLPLELQSRIAAEVEHTVSLLHMRQACKSMRSAVDQDSVWDRAHAHHTWTRRHALYAGPHLPFGKFVHDMGAERAHCRRLTQDIHEVRQMMTNQAIRGMGGHGAGAGAGGMLLLPGPNAQAAFLYKREQELLQRRQIVVDAFAAEGLRAKALSPRQRCVRWICSWFV